jgi:hypothetical protein
MSFGAPVDAGLLLIGCDELRRGGDLRVEQSVGPGSALEEQLHPHMFSRRARPVLTKTG